MKKNSVIIVIIILLFLASSCGSNSDDSTRLPVQDRAMVSTRYRINDQECYSVLNGFLEIMSLDLPEEWINVYYTSDDYYYDLPRVESQFDANQYFSFLTHLNMVEGLQLDYVYFADRWDGYPILYAREESREPFSTFTEYKEAFVQANTMMIQNDSLFFPLLKDAFREDPIKGIIFSEEAYETFHQGYLERIETDTTPEGYFELVMLRFLGGQFYLYWHSNYFDEFLICDLQTLDQAVFQAKYTCDNEKLNIFRESVKGFSFSPKVYMFDQSIDVNLVLFTKWGGLYRYTITLDNEFPYTLLNVDKKIIAPFECGTVF